MAFFPFQCPSPSDTLTHTRTHARTHARTRELVFILRLFLLRFLFYLFSRRTRNSGKTSPLRLFSIPNEASPSTGTGVDSTTAVIIIDRLWQQFVDCCFRDSSVCTRVYDIIQCHSVIACRDKIILNTITYVGL